MLLPLTLIAVAGQGPAPEDVKAGPVAFIVFLLLALAVAVLGFSLVKQLRKAQAAKDAGLYGDAPTTGTDAGVDPTEDRPEDRL